MLDHATGLLFHESNFSQIQAQHNHQRKLVQVFNYGRSPESRNAALEALRHHAQLNATHDSGERSEASRCYPGTRLAVFERIERWIQGQDSREKSSCLWLSGAAGGGKSAVAQTLAERCREQGIVAPSYFLSHTPSGSEQIQSVIHTIAYQLCTPPSTLSQHILQAIHDDPTVFSKGVKLQMEQLIIRPLREACQANPFFKFTTRVVIIDGLDGCGTVKDQQVLASLFMDAITQNNLPLHLFITSRLEPHVLSIFAKYPNSVKQVVLDATFSPSADIAHFIRSSLNELVNGQYQATERPWPVKEIIATIVERSSGQFSYASDVVTYVCSTPNGAESRLQEVLRPRKGHCILPKLDAVFKQILESVESHHVDDVLSTLAWMAIYGGYIAVTDRVNLPDNSISPPFSFPWVSRMLDQPPARVFESFNALRSLFDVPERPESQQPLQIYHASMFEFLADEARAGKTFFMDEAAAHGRIVECMTRHFRLRGVGPVPMPGVEALDELRWMEKVFRCHLVQARPTEELVRSVEALVGLGKQGSHKQQSPPSSPRAGLDAISVHNFTCDTKRTIVCFLKNFYQSQNRKESLFRMTGIQKRLAMFWFFKAFPTKRCGKVHCSCAAGRILGPQSPP